MQIYQLECFFEIAKGKTFLQVSEELNMSQSSVSRAVKALEDELRADLLDRSNRSAALTPAGEILYRDLSDIMPEIRKMIDHMRMFSRQKNILYAIVPYSPFLRFKRFADEYQQINPEYRIQRLDFDSVETAEEALDGYRLDFLITHRSGLPESSDFTSTNLADDRLMLAIPITHPFASLDCISLDAIGGEPLLINAMAHSDFVKVCKNYGVHLNLEYQDISRADLLMSVIEDKKVGVIWESETQLFYLSSVVFVPLKIDPIPFVITYRSNRTTGAQASFLRFCLRESANLLYVDD